MHFARKLRKDSTLSENILWHCIKNRQINNIKFRRQYSVLSYILDFYAPELRLAIEIDGSSHDDKKYEYDRKREIDIEKIGIKILRFTEYEVKTRTTDVLETIYQKTLVSTSPQPANAV